jgi:hypothetical protein
VPVPGATVVLLGGRVARTQHVALELDRPITVNPAPAPAVESVDLRTSPGVLAAPPRSATSAARRDRAAEPVGSPDPGRFAPDPNHGFIPDRLEPGLVCRSVSPASDLGIRAEQFVYDVFRTSGFCAESPRRHVEESEPWREGSTLHVITDDGDHGREVGRDGDEPGAVVGVVRTILGTFDELPVSRFDPAVAVPGGVLCEIGSLAVKSDQRGMGVANELHRAAFLAGIRERCDGFCFLIEEWMFDFFAGVYGLPVRRLAPPSHFMGGDIVPTGMWMPEMLRVIARVRPHVYRWAVEDLEEYLHVELDLPMVPS